MSLLWQLLDSLFPLHGRRVSLLKEVWYGQRSLAETYWIWYWLVGELVIGKGFRFIFLEWAKAIQSMFPIYLFLALVLPYSFWSLVGLFRSARRRKGFWGWAAMITSVMGLVGLVVG